MLIRENTIGPQNKSILRAYQGSMSTEACRNTIKQTRIHIWRISDGESD